MASQQGASAPAGGPQVWYSGSLTPSAGREVAAFSQVLIVEGDEAFDLRPVTVRIGQHAHPALVFMALHPPTASFTTPPETAPTIRPATAFATPPSTPPRAPPPAGPSTSGAPSAGPTTAAAPTTAVPTTAAPITATPPQPSSSLGNPQHAPFPVLRLPLKIRQRIWSLTVQEEEPFFFTDCKLPGQLPQYVRVRDQGGSSQDSLALTLVSKQLESEVIPITYGVNTFAFAHVAAMDTFLRTFEPMRKYMRHVQVVGPDAWKFVYSRNFFSMWPMSQLQLRSITFDYRCIDWQVGSSGGRYQVSLEEFFKSIKWFLRNWHNINKGESDAGSVLGVIRIVGGFGGRCPSCGQGFAACRLQRHSARGCRLWRAEVKRRKDVTYRLWKMIEEDLPVPSLRVLRG